MSPEIRREVLSAVHTAFGALDYGIIGGSALAEYGNTRATSDIDVMVPRGIIEVVEQQLLDRGLVRTQNRGLGFIASDGVCYGVDYTNDQAIGQSFKGRQETVTVGSSPARIMSIDFLLDSKAWAYMDRKGPDADAKKNNDAADIFFILAYMQRRGQRPDPRRCRWIVDHDFWNMFTNDFEGSERQLSSVGLRKDPTPSGSNRSIRRASSESRAGSGSGRSR